MKLFKTLGATAAALLLGTSAQATLLTLPSPNPMSTGKYGDFLVYSLDLLEQCTVSDNRCQPFSADGGTRVRSGEGQVDSEIMILTGTAGGQSSSNYQATSGPFTGNIATVKVDDPFLTPTGNGAASDVFNMESTNEPGGSAAEFTGDVAGRWDALLSSITGLLGTKGLFFIFDNNQTGAKGDQAQYFWGQVKIWNGNTQVACYELNNKLVAYNAAGSGCMTGDPEEPVANDKGEVDPFQPGDFQSSGGVFCVDKITGASYPATGNTCASGATPDPLGGLHAQGGYYITNNLGSNSAEFVAYVPELNANLAAWSAAGYFMSVDYRMRGLFNGNESMWLSGATLPPPLPEPGSLALVSLALLGLGSVARRRRQAQA